MGMLFRPRAPLMRLAADAATDGDRRADHVMRAVRSSREGLARELDAPTGAFSEVELAATAGFSGALAYTEWVVTLRHTGSLTVGDELVVPPTGNRVTVRGVTVAEFSGDRIAAFRQYWDELTLLEGLGLIPAD